jgi:precorrin-8X/cobalt-precorrin-8 methylmutase
MVAAGITRRDVLCAIKDPAAVALAAERAITRSAAALRIAAERAGPGAVFVIGNAPTALFELLALTVEQPMLAPALVIGLPVGFVGATESKAALRATGLPAVSNVSAKGGSAVAAAALNALIYPDLLTEGGGS